MMDELITILFLIICVFIMIKFFKCLFFIIFVSNSIFKQTILLNGPETKAREASNPNNSILILFQLFTCEVFKTMIV